MLCQPGIWNRSSVMLTYWLSLWRAQHNSQSCLDSLVNVAKCSLQPRQSITYINIASVYGQKERCNLLKSERLGDWLVLYQFKILHRWCSVVTTYIYSRDVNPLQVASKRLCSYPRLRLHNAYEINTALNYICLKIFVGCHGAGVRSPAA